MNSQARAREGAKSKTDFVYEEVGAGAPILMLHGLFGSLSNWKHAVEYFSPHYRVINLQFPLYNQEIHTVETLTEYVDAFMKFRRLTKIAIFGNSLGGHVALNYALRQPQKVACLVLAGSGGLFERGFDKSIMIHPDREYLKQKVEEVFFDPSFATEEQLREVEEVVSTTRRKLSLVKIAKSARSFNMRDLLPGILCPVCLVWGKEDKITPPEVAKIFEEHLPNATLRYIDRCGHAPIIERPEEFNRHAMEFLRSLPYE